MVSEREIIISFLFKRSGKENLKFSDLYLALSMELNWFSPDDAKKYISQLLEENLLIKKGDLLKPNFDYENTKIPIGFTPSKRVFEEKKAEKDEIKKVTFLEELINILTEKSKLDKSQISEKIEELAKEKKITNEVAALIIGKEFDINFEKYFGRVEESIFK